MERQPFDLYRVLRRQFPRADHDDVVEAVREAEVVNYLADIRAGGSVRNVEAFSTVVAQRSLGREMRRQKRLLRPDVVEHIDWDQIEMMRQTLPNEEETTAATIDAHDIMDAMPDIYAQVMQLHYLEGLTLDEAAKRIGVSAQCIRKRHERALKWARKRFAGPHTASISDHKEQQRNGEHELGNGTSHGHGQRRAEQSRKQSTAHDHGRAHHGEDRIPYQEGDAGKDPEHDGDLGKAA